MSQYQPNYGYPANYGYSDALAPARRSAVLMYILGAIGILGGILFLGMGVVLQDLLSQPQVSKAFHESNATPEQMQASLIFFGAICLVGGILLIVMGVFVRRGSRGPVVAAMVLDILGLLACALVLLSSLMVSETTGAGANIASAICMLTLPILLLIVLLMWLIQAMRNAGSVQTPYIQPYWQYPPDYHPFPPNAPTPPPPGQIPPPPNFEPPKPPSQ